MLWPESAQDLNRLEDSLSQTVEAAAFVAHQPGTGAISHRQQSGSTMRQQWWRCKIQSCCGRCVILLILSHMLALPAWYQPSAK